MVTDVYGAGGVITTAVRAVHTTVGVAADAATRRIRGLSDKWRQRKPTVTNGNNGFCLAALMLLAALPICGKYNLLL
jgi:hypothetical protein